MPAGQRERISLPLRNSFTLVWTYVRRRILDQVRSVWLIIAYLIFFQVVVLRYNLVDAAALAGGLGLLVLGLAMFLEGLLLGVMPLGEGIGVGMPRRLPFVVVCFFGLTLGIGATLAEPALAALRSAGSQVLPWRAPLLYTLLNRHPDALLLTIAAGVGLAVVLGVIRVYRGWSLRWFVIILSALLVGLCSVAGLNPKLAPVLGLAWDVGGATTGPVTVPLVVALGVGLSRVLERSRDTLAGFGSIALASLTPVISVMILALVLLPAMPEPMSRERFLSEENRAKALEVVGSQEAFDAVASGAPVAQSTQSPLGRNAIASARAVLPLCAFLFLVLLVVLRERLPDGDVAVFGVGLAVVGMMFLGIGIESGLGRLGNQVGQRLPATFREIADADRAIVIPNFDPEVVQRAVSRSGRTSEFFYYEDRGRVLALPYDPESYDSTIRTYTHVPTRRPLLGSFGSLPGIMLLLLFALGLGYGATLAEPALGALGITVEELTGGTLRKSVIVQSVAVGVGVGMAFGLARVIWSIPMMVLLAPPYALAILLTLVSEDSIIGVAWDSGGVTTGPVTVPLVMAMGLSVGETMGAADGFGILALASIYPIVAVLSTGLVFRARRRTAGIPDSQGARRAA